MSAKTVLHLVNNAEPAKSEPPSPLMRELPPADPFPVDALGSILGPAAKAIHDRIQAPVATCGQSVLSAATLAVQGVGNILLPTDQERPISNYFITIAGSGERKSAADAEALSPIRLREAALREEYLRLRLDYENSETAWKKARDVRVKKAKDDRARLKQALDELGPAPQPPLVPILTCEEPTIEGLRDLLAVSWPSVGIFSAEGGQFVGGHSMGKDHKVQTASALSGLWDSGQVQRIRAGDSTVLPGRRVTLHLMIQPEIAKILFSDRILIDQGFLSRTLVTAPAAASGTRTWREPSAGSANDLKLYNYRMVGLLERPLPLQEGSRNELAPRPLQLSPDARSLWIGFYNALESQCGNGGELKPICGLANKLPEHAARIATVLTLVENIDATEVGSDKLAAGIDLAQHYAAEALRLFGASSVSPELYDAQQLLDWLQGIWPHDLVSLPDIYQKGPNTIRDGAKARRAADILVKHGWLVLLPNGAEVEGSLRREVWRVIRIKQ